MKPFKVGKCITDGSLDFEFYMIFYPETCASVMLFSK